MVDAGRVIFQVEIDRASADRAISQLEQRFAGVGDIDLKIPDAGPAARAARTVQDAFSNIQIPEFNFSANTQQLSRSVQSAKDELLTLEQAIEGLQRQRINVEFKVARGDADLAGIESRIERLNRRKLEIPLVTPGAATEIRKIEADIAKLEARRIKVDADTGDARAQLNQLDRTLEGLSGDDAAATLGRLQRELGSTADAAKKAENETKSFSSALSGLAAGAAFAVVDRLVDAFGGAAEAVVGFVSETLQVGGAARSAESALTTILGSAEEAQSVLQDLSNFAATTPFDLPGIRSAGQQLLAFGFNTNELIPTLEAIGNVAAGVNVPFDELAEIYGKARVQGRLFAEDINQLTGRGVPIIAEFAAQFGVAESEVRELVESGQIGFAELEQAFVSLTGEGGKFFDLLGTQSGTVVGQISNLGDTVTQFQEQLFKAFEPALGAGLQTLTATLEETANSSEALDILSAAGDRLAESLSANPELTERLGEALASLADSGASAVATVLDRIGQALENPENIEAFAEGIETSGEALGNLVEIGIAVADALILVGSTYSSLVDTEAVATALGGLADALQAIVSVASNVVDGLGSIADGVERVSGAVPGLRNAVENVGRFGPVIGTAKTAFDSFFGGQEAVAAPEIDISNAVPQQDELDKFVRAARSSNEQIAADSTRSAKAAALERAKANEEAAKEFEEAQKEALANIDIAQQNRIAAVRQNQAAGNISEEQADAQVSEIESDSIRERIQLREDEIAKIEDFASRQVISEKDATDQIRAAREEIADLTLESIESEIDAQDAAREAAEKKAEAAKKAALEQLDAQQQLNDLQAQQVSIQSGIASTALQDQANLIGAQVSLEQSRLSLSRQTLEGKLAEAEAAEDVVAVEEIRDRLLLNQRRSIQAEFNARRQQLQIQQQLTQLDADRQLRLGEIAEAEARIAVERARAEGASADEIQALQQIARLREQETEALQSQAQSKKDILSIQFEQLDADQELANQRATQERREQAIQSFKEQQKKLADEQLKVEKEIASETERRERATSNIVSALAGLSDISSDDALGSLDQLEENARTARRAGALDADQFGQLQGAIDQAQRFGRSGDGFSIEEAFRFAENNANNPFAAGILDQVGLGGVSSLLDSQQEIAIADSQIERLANGLTEVKEAIENIPAGVENLTVSTPDPVADAAQVAAQINRQRRIARGIE